MGPGSPAVSGGSPLFNGGYFQVRCQGRPQASPKEEERLEVFTHFTGTSRVVADVIRQSAFLVKAEKSGDKTLWPRNLDVVDSHDGITDTLIPSHGVSLSQQNLHIGLNLQDFFVEERNGIVHTGDIVLQYHLPVAPQI